MFIRRDGENCRGIRSTRRRKRVSLAHSPQSWGLCAAAQNADIDTYGQKSLREEQRTVINWKTTSIPATFQYPAPGVTLLPNGALRVV